MLLALALAMNLASSVPVRWPSDDPASLELLAGTPANCVLLEKSAWSAAFSEAAREAGISLLGVVRDTSELSGQRP